MDHAIGSDVSFFLLPVCIEYDSHMTFSGVIINRMCIVTNLFLFYFAALSKHNVRDTI